MNIKISDIIRVLEEALPLRLQEGWDNSGLQVGIPETSCSGVLLTLDITEEILQEAVDRGCNLVVAHHPVLFKGLKRLSQETYIERCVSMAVKNDIAIYAAHTNADVAPEGLNMLLAKELGLSEVKILSAGIDNSGLGAIGILEKSVAYTEYIEHLKAFFGSRQVKSSPSTPSEVYRVALCGGSGSFLAREAKRQGADVFITGEAKYNDYFDAEGIGLITVGHYESEFIATRLFDRIISEVYPGITHITRINHNPVISY